MKQRLLILFCCVFFFTVIDFNSVDVFPLFPTCDSIPSQEKQKICSQIKLSEQIYASLSTQEIISTDKLNDTILIKLNIDNSGKVSLSSLIANDHINQQIPNLDSLIESGIEKLPLLKPAIKRGMPVTTEFTLPIIVKN
jgi:hypothetical protein